jgi:hypothetical protein
MNRRRFLGSSLIAGISVTAFSSRRAGADIDAGVLDYKLSLQSPAKLFDGKESYCHPRAGIVPGAGKGGDPRVVMTMTTIALNGNDVYKAMYGLSTNDLGQTWTSPAIVPELCYRMETIDAVERPVACSDFSPVWHQRSKSLLGTGHTVVYLPDWKYEKERPRDTSYAVYDSSSSTWSAWRKLEMPDEPQFTNAGAGSTQRYDLADGTILLPCYFRQRGGLYKTTVLRCSFDGQELKYEGHGDEIENDEGRGLSEPSITQFNDNFYLTIRHDQRSYVTRGRDGQHFEPIKAWTFENGDDLGTYSTQQHWVTHSDGLFLVYNRRGANNDHVFRHRAPLFVAEVDPDRLVVLRKTERELMPNRGARYGNFGVTNVSANETWVTDAEWMQPKGCEKYGSDGSVWVAKIHWGTPNKNF